MAYQAIITLADGDLFLVLHTTADRVRQPRSGRTDPVRGSSCSALANLSSGFSGSTALDLVAHQVSQLIYELADNGPSCK